MQHPHLFPPRGRPQHPHGAAYQLSFRVYGEGRAKGDHQAEKGKGGGLLEEGVSEGLVRKDPVRGESAADLLGIHLSQPLI